MKKAIVFFADGMEECEALLTVDILRRGGVEVTTASVMEKRQVVSSHGLPIVADAMADEVCYAEADMVVYPGGMPGSTNLAASGTAVRQAKLFAATGKYVAAICAAPSVVLAAAGLLEGKQATSHPGFQDKLAGATVLNQNVVIDGNIITGRALGAGIDFGLELVSLLVDRDTAKGIAKAIAYDWE